MYVKNIPVIPVSLRLLQRKFKKSFLMSFTLFYFSSANVIIRSFMVVVPPRSWWYLRGDGALCRSRLLRLSTF